MIGGGDEGNEETTGADAWDSVEGKWHKLWEGTNLWWAASRWGDAMNGCRVGRERKDSPTSSGPWPWIYIPFPYY